MNKRKAGVCRAVSRGDGADMKMRNANAIDDMQCYHVERWPLKINLASIVKTVCNKLFVVKLSKMISPLLRVAIPPRFIFWRRGFPVYQSLIICGVFAWLIARSESFARSRSISAAAQGDPVAGTDADPNWGASRGLPIQPFSSVPQQPAGWHQHSVSAVYCRCPDVSIQRETRVQGCSVIWFKNLKGRRNERSLVGVA